ncbi:MULTISPECIES: riboflavin synthase [unclassified Dehalobacter]|uniref:riboflavin synthase n=1 Tax=unclassified Dehalobacter TaxID=2635733 RepID=UPI000E6C8EDB|nr:MULTISPECIES: riboflavin synthase [unclassified Dehalobacter]RJE48469.1 riboflavin synthase subunit alpha [Dehalobacter sp. MCB1]TCX50538.1 riboflavin synthase [Dehalobacter sp. 14DCB1]TCX52222.1 riboflavin synthase [Dehalobacter sp. 12DCB1]
MFTGIIEELGTIKSLDLLKDSARLTIDASFVLKGSQIGDSIAVNGVCLTATVIGSGNFSVDVMYETLQRTNLHELKQHTKVNLERALQLQSRLGGHLVSGHVDGIGKITAMTPVGIAQIYRIQTSPEITSSLLPKGSVAIDGISLTVIDVGDDYFTVSLIPHTFQHTTLGFKRVGSTVNLETDIIGKYVARFLQKDHSPPQTKKDISVEFLTENGFI